ncbi:HU family DNA-binding protein [Thomasclavelia cocleata]|uniref:Integration host factor subunit alpha n=1 Tax=Thomasclavelia cocleata TaxID=69824 RepID=A0A1I0BJ91_9FIRM|nr:HU family DNA-binding protein [Thomasclavelia cocleata]MCR1960222.1 integration host factor subunit beta [Thomasclavelia cocleata]SET06904.1 integration host factor subunit alpha [Thomasclavelia cocleata]
MNKEILIAKICNKVDGCTKDEVKIIFDAVIESIRETIVEFGKIKIRGFGVFEVKNYKERIGTHPKTNQKIVVPSFNTIKFKCSNIFKSEVNQ